MDDKEIIKIVEQLLKNLVLIPGGTFLMGSPSEDKDADASGFPRHLVTVQPFKMGKFLVTQLQWEAIRHLSKVNIELPSYTLKPKIYNHPIDTMTWFQALEFCNRLSAFTGLDISLPSEAQWEYAYRAGTSTPHYWGDYSINSMRKYKSSLFSEVGSFSPPNPYGLYDMYGNVMEWCLDTWHWDYKGAPTDGSPWLDNSTVMKVVRGAPRSPYRTYMYESRITNHLGFRTCM